MPVSACPMCRKPSAVRSAEKSPWPFCSERCQLIDLGKWLDEDYRIPEGPEGSAALPDPQTDD